MKKTASSRAKIRRSTKADPDRPSIGIRDLKIKASAIIEDVKGRRVSYAVTHRGAVEALIVPADGGEPRSDQPTVDGAWDNWQALVSQLTKASGKKAGAALAELERMRR